MEAAEVDMLSFSVTVTDRGGRDQDIREDRGMLHVLLRLELAGRRPKGRKWRFLDAVKENMRSVGFREEDAVDMVVLNRTGERSRRK